MQVEDTHTFGIYSLKNVFFNHTFSHTDEQEKVEGEKEGDF